MDSPQVTKEEGDKNRAGLSEPTLGLGQSLVLIAYTSLGGWHTTRGWTSNSLPPLPHHWATREPSTFVSQAFVKLSNSMCRVVLGLLWSHSGTNGLLLAVRFPHGLCNRTYAEHSLYNNFSSEIWRNLQGQLPHRGKCPELIINQRSSA